MRGSRSIARLIYHMLGPRPEVMRELRVGQRAMSRRARQLRGCDRVQAKADPTTQAAWRSWRPASFRINLSRH